MPPDTTRDATSPWRDGDVWVNRATGLRLAVERSAAASGGAALAWRAQYPEYSPEPPAHLHPRQTERFTMLEGALRVRHRGVVRELAAGDTLEVRPGEPHAMWNPYGQPAVSRWETTPALQTERLFGMLVALAQAGRTDRSGVPRFVQTAVLARAYRDELRLCRPPAWVQALLFIPTAWIGRLSGVRADRIGG